MLTSDSSITVVSIVEPIVESNDVEGTIHAISMKSILTYDYLKSLK